MVRWRPEAELASLEDVPDDVFGNILGRLCLTDLLSLGRVSRCLHDRIEQFGVPLYLSNHPHTHITLIPPAQQWKPQRLVRYQHQIGHSLRHRKWHALQIGPTWRDAVIPTLSLSSSRLILGVGGKLLVHPLYPQHSLGGKAVGKAREYMIARRDRGSETDIVGAIEMPNDEVVIAQYDGTLQRFSLGSNGSLKSIAHYAHPKRSNLHTLSVGSEGELITTITSSGLVSTFKTKSPWIPPNTFEIKDRAWSSMTISRHPHLPPAVYIGITGGVAIHSLEFSGSAPMRFLTGPDLPSRSSPYDMTFPSQPSAHHPSLLLSSWYDSYLRLHDLRTSSSSPVLEFFDPWQWADGSAVYSTTFLAENHIAGGGARHGSVCLFDIRQPKTGWSIFSPGGKGSPVYALKGEGGRLWGVTEKRAFVLAFDGSGDLPDGLVMQEARAPKERAKERPSGWKGRGGKWNWTVSYDEVGEGCSGYDHDQRGVALFESIRVT